MTEEEAEAEEKKGNHATKTEDGYRSVPLRHLSRSILWMIYAVRALSDADQVVIACGGGGIPVLMQENNLQGASAVIEKDLAAGKLAELVDAETLVILHRRAEGMPELWHTVRKADRFHVRGRGKALYGRGTVRGRNHAS